MHSFQINFLSGTPEEVRAERLDSSTQESLLVFLGVDGEEINAFSKAGVSEVEVKDGHRPAVVWRNDR